MLVPLGRCISMAIRDLFKADAVRSSRSDWWQLQPPATCPTHRQAVRSARRRVTASERLWRPDAGIAPVAARADGRARRSVAGAAPVSAFGGRQRVRFPRRRCCYWCCGAVLPQRVGHRATVMVGGSRSGSPFRSIPAARPARTSGRTPSRPTTCRAADRTGGMGRGRAACRSCRREPHLPCRASRGRSSTCGRATP